MRKCLLIMYLLLPVFSRDAVAQIPTPVTLEEVLRLGETNRFELKAQQLQVKIASGEEAKRRARWRPQVSASADFRWNTQLQTSIFKDAPFANGEDIVVKFGVPFNNLLNIQADQTVYNAQLRTDRRLN